MRKICTVVGARPQFIKAATISREISNSDVLREVIIHTGQHHDAAMSDVFFQELSIPKPKYHLDINGGTHAQMTGAMLMQIEQVLQQEQPNAVLVYGDTNSTLAGAIAAAKLNIPIVHVEAGLRSKNMLMPEEINRIVTDKLSTLLCCPTSAAVQNLHNEGITEGVSLTGDVMFDATLYAIEKLKSEPAILEQINKLPPYALLTIHRAQATESIDSLQELLEFVIAFAKTRDLQIVFPVHPRTRKLLSGIKSPELQLIDPVGYLAMQAYLSRAQYVLTDSGGLQKEAYFHKVPCITLRSETEWVETITHGWNRLWTQSDYQPRTTINEYGQGSAAQVIKQMLVQKIV